MMEEVGDDTNGESTFEFVGDKTDEGVILQQADPVSSTPTSSMEQSSSSSPTTTIVSSNSMPTSSSIFSAFPSTSEPFITMLPAQNALSSPYLTPVSSSNPDPIPMYAPHQTGPPSGAFVSTTTPIFSSPVESVSTQQSLLQSGPPVEGTIPIQTSPQPNYMPFPEVSSQCSALDLPLDDNFVSSSSQVSQEGRGVWGWIKGSEFLNKVAEKAKSSVDSVITTLDPGMKEIIYSGGDVSIVVASDKEAKVSAIREAFQQVFGRATVQGIATQSSSIAPQPVGYSAGTKAAEERINNLRQQGMLRDHQVIIAIENFLAELTPDKWYDLGCLLLQDPATGVTLQVYTEAIPVSNYFVTQVKDQTPADYPLRWSGFAITIGQVLGPALGVHHSKWHQALTGVSRREILILAARTLAGMYRAQLRR